MSYSANETGAQTAQPVELYTFTTGRATIPGVVHPVSGRTFDAPVAPAAPGTLVVPWYRLPSQGASHQHLVDILDCTAPHSVYGINGQAGSACCAFAGGLGDGGGYLYQEFSFGSAYGILPNHSYLLRALAWASEDSFMEKGVRLVGDLALPGATLTPAYFDFPVTTDADAVIRYEVGAFDLEAGSAYVVYLAGVAVFDAETDPPGDTTGGIPGGLVTRRYTSADVDVAFQGATYTSAVLTRARFATGGNEAGASNLEVTLPRDHALVSAAGPPPRPPTSVTVTRVHRADVAAGTSYVTPWTGQLVERRFQGPSCTLVFAGPAALLERKVPRYLTQRSCGHMFGDGRCQKSLADVRAADLEVTAISGRVVTVAGAQTAADDLIAGSTTLWQHGILTAPNGLSTGIESFNGTASDDLTLKLVIPGLVVGDLVTLTGGCGKAIADCAERDNVVHFGGEPVMPIRNPGTGAGLGVSEGSA